MLPGLSYLGRTARDGATTLIGSETQGLAFDFTDQSAVIIDTDTPANSYSSVGIIDRNGALVGPAGKLTYSSPSPKMCMQSDGKYRYGAHNLLLASQSMENVAPWSIAGSGAGFILTSVANAQTAPDGTTTASQLLEVAAGGSAKQLSQSITLAGNIYRYAMYIKPVSRTWARLMLYDGTSSHTAYFDVASGVVGTASSGVTSSMSAAGNNWYLCEMVVTTAAGSGVAYFNGSLADSGVDTYSGEAAKGYYVWGAQVSLYPVASGYVSTTTAAKYSLPYEWNTSGVCQGLLVEEARTNLLTYSNTLSNAAWTKTRLTITADATTSPSGATDACKLEEDNTAGSSHEVVASFAKAASAIQYTTTFYAKQAERNWIAVAVFDGSADGTRVWFNLATGAVGTTAAIGAGFTNVTTSITSVGNGWYRCRVTATSSATAAFSVTLYSTTADNVAASNGTTGSGLYIWNVQVEAGAFPTSPILTGSATVTRTVDNISMSTTLAPSFAAGHTMFAHGTTPPATGGPGSRLFNIGSGGVDYDEIALFAGSLFGLNNVAGVDKLNRSIAMGYGADVRAAIAVFPNDGILCVNGTLSSANATSDPESRTEIRIGTNASGNYPWNSHIKRVSLVPRRKTNVELQAETA